MTYQMKKAVLICSGNNFPKGVFEFVRQQQKLEPLLLTGAFFYNMTYKQLLVESLHQAPWPALLHTEEDEMAVNESVNQFEQLCIDSSIEYTIHKESPLWNLDDIVIESRFADVLLLSEELFYAAVHAQQPNYFLQHLLHYSECPILLVPEDFKTIKSLSVAYDGKKESMFALKQFCYLFPQLAEMETEILFAKDEANAFIPYSSYLKEYAGRHFRNLNYKKMHSSPKTVTELWMQEQKDILIISGAFSRSLLSMMLEKSFIENAVEDHRCLLFIAHSC